MPRKRSSRIYLKRGRFYADFRDYADVGGSKEALVALGSRFATQDRAEAERLANAQLQRYERLSKAVGHVKGARDFRRFGAYIEHHLALKAAASPATNQWLESVEVHLDTAKAFFGAGILLDKISVSLVSDYVIHLATLPNGRLLTNGKGVAMLSPSTQRKYLNSLSNLFRRAISEGYLPPGANPVTALLDKPTGEPEEADWLEADEAALVLYAARIYRPMREDLALRCVYALVATLLLTGGRLAEVLGLEIGDVNFQRETITFRRNTQRRLKNRHSARTVPLWPQLAEILHEYLNGPDRPSGKLLFPTPGAEDKPVTEIRRVLDELAYRAGLERKLRSKMCRHTYCAARLQTTDGEKSVALYTVSRELGHNSSRMVEKVYGHLGRVRLRGEAVEFRVDEFRREHADRIAVLEKLSRTRCVFPPNLARRAPLAVEIAALDAALEAPENGSAKVAERMKEKGLQTSGSGVRWIWDRHGIRRKEMRVAAVRSGRLSRVVEQLRNGMGA